MFCSFIPLLFSFYFAIILLLPRSVSLGDPICVVNASQNGNRKRRGVRFAARIIENHFRRYRGEKGKISFARSPRDGYVAALPFILSFFFFKRHNYRYSINNIYTYITISLRTIACRGYWFCVDGSATKTRARVIPIMHVSSFPFTITLLLLVIHPWHLGSNYLVHQYEQSTISWSLSWLFNNISQK